MVQINGKACIGCRACIQDCPVGNLIMENRHAAVKGPCIQCGHCVAICPRQAVSIPEYDMQQVEAYHPETFPLDADKLMNAIKFRRSVRDYAPQPVEKAKLDFIIDAGRYTATAVNRQGCRFIVVQDTLAELRRLIWDGIGDLLENPPERAPEGLEAYRAFYEAHQKDARNDFLFRNAPAVLFIASSNTLDAGLAAQNMELAAVSQGLGMLYNGYLLRAASAVPGAEQRLQTGGKPLAACMLLGIPAVTYRRTAPRRKADAVYL